MFYYSAIYKVSDALSNNSYRILMNIQNYLIRSRINPWILS